MSSDLPARLVPTDVDRHDMPIPREAFARMAVMECGITIEEARAPVHETADWFEGKRTRKLKRGRK